MEYNASLHLQSSLYDVHLDFFLHLKFFCNFVSLRFFDPFGHGIWIYHCIVTVNPLFYMVTEVILCLQCISNMDIHGSVYQVVFREKKETKFAVAFR